MPVGCGTAAALARDLAGRRRHAGALRAALGVVAPRGGVRAFRRGGDGGGEEWVAVREVRRAVERIHAPAVGGGAGSARRAARATRLLAEPRMVGEAPRDLGAHVGLGAA